MINKIINSLRSIPSNIKKYFGHESCYKQRELEGTATMGCCNGLWGGDYYTDYLQYSCVGCRYYVDTKK